MSRRRSISVSVDVDIDLDDINTDDLVEELQSRGVDASEPECLNDAIREMFYAFKLGREDLAIILARKVAQEFTGKIL